MGKVAGVLEEDIVNDFNIETETLKSKSETLKRIEGPRIIK